MAQVPSPSPNTTASPTFRSVACCAEALNHHLGREPHTNRIGHIKADRSHLKHHAALERYHTFDTMRLRVIDPNDVANPQVTGRDLINRHADRVGLKRHPRPRMRNRRSRSVTNKVADRCRGNRRYTGDPVKYGLLT